MTDHARRSDPRSSDRAVKSIVRDDTLAAQILSFASELTDVALTDDTTAFGLFNDTILWEALEQRLGRRLQRNVIARARGRLVNDGHLVGVGGYPYNGVELEHYALAP